MPQLEPLTSEDTHLFDSIMTQQAAMRKLSSKKCAVAIYPELCYRGFSETTKEHCLQPALRVINIAGAGKPLFRHGPKKWEDEGKILKAPTESWCHDIIGKNNPLTPEIQEERDTDNWPSYARSLAEHAKEAIETLIDMKTVIIDKSTRDMLRCPGPLMTITKDGHMIEDPKAETTPDINFPTTSIVHHLPINTMWSRLDNYYGIRTPFGGITIFVPKPHWELLDPANPVENMVFVDIGLRSQHTLDQGTGRHMYPISLTASLRSWNVLTGEESRKKWNQVFEQAVEQTYPYMESY